MAFISLIQQKEAHSEPLLASCTQLSILLQKNLKKEN
jgi:hypothetical protein